MPLSGSKIPRSTGVPDVRHPGRIAHDERGAPLGKEVRRHDRHLPAEAEPLDVVARAGQRPRIDVVATTRHAATREHGGQHAGARADVERRAVGRQRRRHGRVARGDQVDVFASDRRDTP